MFPCLLFFNHEPSDLAMKTKTYFIIAAIIVASNACSYYAGSHDIYMAADVYKDGSTSISYPHSYNIKEALSFERQYANALREGLHRFYSNDDNDIWFTGFMHTKEYQKIDSLNQGDWEDFYYYETPIIEDWYTTYGTVEEPSEIFKDTISSNTVKLLQNEIHR